MISYGEEKTKDILSKLPIDNSLTSITLARYPGNDLSLFESFNASKLTKLSISGNRTQYSSITSLKGIENASILKEAYFSYTMLSNIADIVNCTSLNKISFTYCNSLKNLNGIEGCTNLTSLVVTNSSLSDISAIKNCTLINILKLSNNEISDISAISNLSQIATLELFDNSIIDLKPLENLIIEGKLKFDTLNLSNNLIQTVSINGTNNVETLKKLYEAGLKKLDVSGNNFTLGSTDELKELNWEYIE